jgi:hypothetical protein
MVGRKAAIFTGVEVKIGRDKESPQQINFKNTVKDHGGIAFVARSIADLNKGIEDYIGY